MEVTLLVALELGGSLGDSCPSRKEIDGFFDRLHQNGVNLFGIHFTDYAFQRRFDLRHVDTYLRRRTGASVLAVERDGEVQVGLGVIGAEPAQDVRVVDHRGGIDHPDSDVAALAAAHLVGAGHQVTIVERDQEPLDRGLGVVRKNYERSRSTTPEQVEQRASPGGSAREDQHRGTADGGG